MALGGPGRVTQKEKAKEKAAKDSGISFPRGRKEKERASQKGSPTSRLLLSSNKRCHMRLKSSGIKVSNR